MLQVQSVQDCIFTLNIPVKRYILQPSSGLLPAFLDELAELLPNVCTLTFQYRSDSNSASIIKSRLRQRHYHEDTVPEKKFSAKLSVQDGQILARAIIRLPSLTSLILRNAGVTDEILATMFNAFRERATRPSLVDLDLSYNKLTCKGMEHLVKDGIHIFNSTLHSLDLSGNYIRSQGAQALARMMKQNSSSMFLRELNLRINLFGDDGGAIFFRELAFCDSSEEVASNSLQDKGVNNEDLLTNLFLPLSLSHLDLSSNEIASNTVIELVRCLSKGVLPNIRVLDLSCNQFCDADVTLLVKSIEEMCDALGHQSRKSELVSVELRGNNGISSSSANALRKLDALLHRTVEVFREKIT